MTALSERPFPSWTPRFGERLVNIYKPESDPHRVATFVRVRRFPPTTRWQMTDERGSFWLVEPRAMERPETVGGAGKLGVCPCCNQRLTTDRERTDP